DLSEAAQVEALSLPMQASAERGASTKTGSLLYIAPELRRGGNPTAAGDVYALGILLYQMVVGDLEKPLAAGWENDFEDEVLRSDIAAAAAGDPARRIPSAAVLADRLENLDARRRKLVEDREDAVRAVRLGEADRRARLRRPWMVLAAATLVLGIVATGAAALRAMRERDEVSRQARIVHAVNLFLTDDLLGRGNPIVSGKANETLMEAVSNAEARIPFRLAKEPAIAASIYYSLAQAFAGRGAFREARTAYDKAAAAFIKAQGPDSPDAIIAMLRRAQMEAYASDAGSLERAKQIIARAAKRIDGTGARAPEARVWLLAAQGTLGMVGGDAGASEKQFREAADLADTMPDTFDTDTRLFLRQREAFAEFRLGRWGEAQALFTDVLNRYLALHGPLHPDTLIARLNIAQVQMARGAAMSAVRLLNDDFIRQLTAVFGPGHHAVLTALAARARSLMALGRYEDALRDNEEVHRAAVAGQGENSQFAILALTDIADAQCREGHTDAGTDSATRAYAAAMKSFPNTPTIAQDIGMTRALCLIAAGKYADADTLLQRVDVKAVGEFEADPDVEAKRDLMLADIAAGSGDTARARTLLAKSGTIFGAPDADPYLRSELLRVRAAVAQQNAEFSKLAPAP
ncbi:MAG TPA: tetratricopeptide repeat-containing protein kinase family protein, partial [Rhizomicrobium sp.]|nr:tetratricopeptide repeat-containing protein kinase family protein [Rhizomicrobium sp.]